AVQGGGRDDGVVRDRSVTIEVERTRLRVDAGRGRPIGNVAAPRQPPAYSVQAEGRIEKGRVVSCIGVLLLSAPTHLHRVDRRFVAVLWSDLAEEPGGITLMEGVEEDTAQRAAEPLPEPGGHGIGLAIRAPGQDFGESSVADRLREGEEIVLNWVRHHKTAEISGGFPGAKKQHGGPPAVTSYLGRPCDQAGDGRIAPEDPVPSAELEAISLTLIGRTDASGMIETLEDGEAARHPGGQAGHSSSDDPPAHRGPCISCV